MPPGITSLGFYSNFSPSWFSIYLCMWKGKHPKHYNNTKIRNTKFIHGADEIHIRNISFLRDACNSLEKEEYVNGLT